MSYIDYMHAHFTCMPIALYVSVTLHNKQQNTHQVYVFLDVNNYLMKNNMGIIGTIMI